MNDYGGMLAQSGEDLQRMNDTRKIPEAGEQDVNEEVAVATTFKEDADGWQEDGENDFADVTRMQTLSV
jgi:hypothetical protein